MKSDGILLRIVCAMMVNAVLFGTGAVIVLATPELAAYAKYLIPAVVVASFLLAPLLAGFIARRMRIRNWGSKKEWREGDAISGCATSPGGRDGLPVTAPPGSGARAPARCS